MDEKAKNEKIKLTDEEIKNAAGGYEEYWTTDMEMAERDTIDSEPLFFVGERVCVHGDELGNGEVVEIAECGRVWQYKIDYDSFMGRIMNGDWVVATQIYGHYNY